jgi:hypothetical protein
MPYADSEVARFWSNVDVRGSDECWPWLRPPGGHGYGQFRSKSFRPGRQELAHRIAFLLANGRWPDHALHECDYPLCCNPAHIFDGTQAENLADMRRKGRGYQLPPMRGEGHARATITAPTAHHIRALRGDGLTCPAISARLGISLHIVKDVVRGKTWRADR